MSGSVFIKSRKSTKPISSKSWDDLINELYIVEKDPSLTVEQRNVLPITPDMIDTMSNFSFSDSTSMGHNHEGGDGQSDKIRVVKIKCENCDNIMREDQMRLICENCGLEICETFNEENEGTSAHGITDCNIDPRSCSPFRIWGNGKFANTLRRTFIQTCSNYNKFSKNLIYKTLMAWNAEGELPKTVLKRACDIFEQVKKTNQVYRKDCKNGLLSACLYYACYEEKLMKTPGEVAKFCHIEEKFHSHGDRILRSLNELGYIQIPTKINPVEYYLIRYIKILNIPDVYVDFLIQLIDRAERKKIHLIHDSKHNSKCIGAIYILVTQVKSLSHINKDEIEKKCVISKTTFTKYALVIFKYYKKFKKVFKKHKIPMPRYWKTTKPKATKSRIYIKKLKS